MKKTVFLLKLILVLSNCTSNKRSESELNTRENLTPDIDNGGLYLPDGFGAIVVSDGVGPSRHIAVKSNGDIYVKLRKASGRNGNVALRDNNGNG